MERKQSQGRKKIEMKMITDENARRITFSKRRHGLFKKASELCTLCGVDIAIVLFSLSGKAFSFGSPNVDSIVNRFLNQEEAPPSYGVPTPHRQAGGRRQAAVDKLNQQFHELNRRLEAEKCRNQETLSQGLGFDAYMNQLDLDQLEQLKRSMEELKKNVARRVGELISEGSSKGGEGSNPEKNDEDNALAIPPDWLKL